MSTWQELKEESENLKQKATVLMRAALDLDSEASFLRLKEAISLNGDSEDGVPTETFLDQDPFACEECDWAPRPEIKNKTQSLAVHRRRTHGRSK